MEQVHILVSGRVQGVFFRASTQKKAGSLGLTGWVRNLPDGRVEVRAAGSRARLVALVDWCKGGPPEAIVAGTEVQWGSGDLGTSSFEIRP